MAFDGHIYGEWNSEGVFEREYRECRQLGPAQKGSGWNFAVLADGGVNSVEDLVDKDFVPGAPGSGSASDADLFLKHIGLYDDINRSEEHTSELQSLMRISYAVFCLKTKNTPQIMVHSTMNKQINKQIRKNHKRQTKQ